MAARTQDETAQRKILRRIDTRGCDWFAIQPLLNAVPGFEAY
ncbi:MAG: hypothetical protein AB7G24_07785 [Novosphingobium sp.]